MQPRGGRPDLPHPQRPLSLSPEKCSEIRIGAHVLDGEEQARLTRELLQELLGTYVDGSMTKGRSKFSR